MRDFLERLALAVAPAVATEVARAWVDAARERRERQRQQPAAESFAAYVGRMR